LVDIYIPSQLKKKKTNVLVTVSAVLMLSWFIERFLVGFNIDSVAVFVDGFTVYC
jgi:predicted secreted protein